MSVPRVMSTVVIGVAGSFSEGGQPFRPAKIQSLPAKIFSCQGGPSSPILFCHAKLLCQTVLPMGKYCRWMAAKQSKIEEKLENMVETNQKWQKTDKNDRKPWKMWSFANYLLPSSHFCPAKLPFLSCQAAISVLPSSHFCPAKLTNFSRGGPRPPRPPPLLRLWLWTKIKKMEIRKYLTFF